MRARDQQILYTDPIYTQTHTHTHKLSKIIFICKKLSFFTYKFEACSKLNKKHFYD